MDIEGLGEEVALNILAQGVIVDVADIYDLTEEQLMGRKIGKKSFKEKSARSLLAAIEISKRQPFKRVLFALGLPGVGSVTAEALADHFGSIERPASTPQPEEIEEVEGVGPIMAVQIAESLADEPTWELIEKLEAKGLRLEADASERAPGGRTAGRQDGGPHRHPAGADPRGGGGAGQVGRRQGDQLGLEENRLRRRRRNPGSKLAKAEKFGTEILDEAALRDLVGS